MASVEQRLQDDVKAAMRAGRKDELAVLRMVMADLKNAAIAEGRDRTGLPDELVVKVLRKAIKTRTESATMYADAGRTDLADVETFQIGVLERYMPREASEEELERVIDAVIAELGATDRKAMGAVMKEVLARLAGRADGKAVSALVSARLA